MSENTALEPIIVTAEPTAEQRDPLDQTAASPTLPDYLWQALAGGLTWSHEDPSIDREVKRILAQPTYFDVLSKRALPALPWIMEAIATRDLPTELALIPIVESMLDPWAYSSQSAAGLWQISPDTADHLDLPRNSWYDARLDIPRATEVALDYLEQLHRDFNGDWTLALAAYNAGPGRIRQALRRAEKAGSKPDYWSLQLPRETQRYLPKILALSRVIRTPEQFEVALAELPLSYPMRQVSIPAPLELALAADWGGLALDELQKANPAYLRWATGPGADSALWLPTDEAARLEQRLKDMPQSEWLRWQEYRVAAGDTLTDIADRFETRVAILRSLNGIEGSLIRAGQALKIPASGNSNQLAVATTRSWPPRSRATRYTIDSGDSLWSISRRFGLEVDKLMRWNNLDPDIYLQPGQVLRLTP